MYGESTGWDINEYMGGFGKERFTSNGENMLSCVLEKKYVLDSII